MLCCYFLLLSLYFFVSCVYKQSVFNDFVEDPVEKVSWSICWENMFENSKRVLEAFQFEALCNVTDTSGGLLTGNITFTQRVNRLF